MKVLIIHRYFWPENVSAFALILGGIARFHADRGDLVAVAAGASEDYSARYAQEFAGKVQVTAFRAEIDRRLGLTGRIRNTLRLLVAGLSALFSQRWDLIYVVSYPPGLAFLLLAAARLFARTRHAIYYVQDNLVYRVPTRPGKYAFGRIQSWTMRMASRVITLSEMMKEELDRLLPSGCRSGSGQKVVAIPNYSPDISAPRNAADAEPVRDIIYAGSHGPGQNLRFFLEAIARLDEPERPRVAFFGEGSEKEALVALANRLGISKHVSFHGNVDRDTINREMERSRFGLVGAIPGLFRYAFPSKLASYNSAGIPGLLMCESSSAIARWAEGNGVGFALGVADPAESAAILSRILRAPSWSGLAMQSAAQRLYGRETYMTQLDQLLSKLEI